jgi:hypothetical protein
MDLGKKGGMVWIACIWLRIGTNCSPYEHGNEPSSSIKGGEFLGQMIDY